MDSAESVKGPSLWERTGPSSPCSSLNRRYRSFATRPALERSTRSVRRPLPMCIIPGANLSSPWVVQHPGCHICQVRMGDRRGRLTRHTPAMSDSGMWNTFSASRRYSSVGARIVTNRRRIRMSDLTIIERPTPTSDDMTTVVSRPSTAPLIISNAHRAIRPPRLVMRSRKKVIDGRYLALTPGVLVATGYHGTGGVPIGKKSGRPVGVEGRRTTIGT